MRSVTAKTFGAFLVVAFCLEGLQSAEMSAEPFARIYLDYHVEVDGKEPPQFEIERAYFGLKGKGDFSMMGKANYNLTLDVHSGADLGKVYWVPYLKVAMLEWQFVDAASIAFGLQGTQLWSVQERLMGYRSVMKTFMDINGFYSSADLGANLKLLFLDEMLTMNAFVFNGDGYNQAQHRETMNTGLNLVASTKDMLPFAEVILYGVVQFGINSDDDFRPGERKKTDDALDDGELISYPDYEVVGLRPIVAGMLGFKNDVIRGYVEVATQQNYKWYAFERGDDAYEFNAMGLSVFAAWGVPVDGLMDRFGLYARMDTNMSDVYEGENDPDNLRTGGVNTRTTGDAGLMTIWAGLELTFDRAFQTVLSYKWNGREAHTFEKADPRTKDGVSEHAFLVDMQLQF